MVVPEAIRRWEHLTGGDLVVDIGQHVKHQAIVRHGGVRAQTTPDLAGQNLEICSQESLQRGQRQGLIPHRRSPVECTKLAVAVGYVG